MNRHSSRQPTPLTHLGKISIEEFLKDYWQQKPLLIRQAFPNFCNPISPDELAGLALEEEIESRIVLENGNTPWELRNGPFEENEFAQLPASDWTLLIQSVDHWIPELSDLLDRFRFIPNWRLDDIMASYAVTGGSVGPHFDQYDVFLLQANGQRHWQVGQKCTSLSPTLANTDLSILEEFKAEESWTLNPGDMLYIPPQIAHWGTALDDDCITYSIGFRAPSQTEILEDFLQEKMSQLSEDQRFSDPGFKPQTEPGLLDQSALQQVKSILLDAVNDDSEINRWFGRFMTRPKPHQSSPLFDDCDPTDETTIEWDSLEQIEQLIERNPASRFCYQAGKESELLDLFIDGEQLQASATLCKLLCNKTFYRVTELKFAITHEADEKVVAELIAKGVLLIEEAEE